MRFLRSWPQRIPANRNYVVDDMERLVINNHDYTALLDVDDSVLLLEWDIAVSPDDLSLFVEQIDPSRVLVAPYRLYLPRPVWAHRHFDGTNRRFVETGDPACNLFGLGMVYLPRDVITGFLSSKWARHFGDVQLSTWHYHNVAKEVPICWQAWPVHLNHPPFLSPQGKTVTPQGDTTMPDDRRVAALLREHDALLRAGKTDRAAEVEKELAQRGHKAEPKKVTPQGRSSKPKDTTDSGGPADAG